MQEGSTAHFKKLQFKSSELLNATLHHHSSFIKKTKKLGTSSFKYHVVYLLQKLNSILFGIFLSINHDI